MCYKKIKIFFIFYILLFTLLTCSSIRVTNPGSNPGIHNETSLVNATHKTLEKADLPFSKLQNKKVYLEVLSQNKARITSLILPTFREHHIQLTEDKTKADIIVKIIERLGGVNIRNEFFGFWLGIGMTSFKDSAQAKSVLYIEIIDTNSDTPLYAKLVSSGVHYTDISRNSVFWLFYLPIPLESYSSTGEDIITPGEPIPVVKRDTSNYETDDEDGFSLNLMLQFYV